jgi:hypothetical protein
MTGLLPINQKETYSFDDVLCQDRPRTGRHSQEKRHDRLSAA